MAPRAGPGDSGSLGGLGETREIRSFGRDSRDFLPWTDSRLVAAESLPNMPLAPLLHFLANATAQTKPSSATTQHTHSESPLIRRYKDVCVHVAYKGFMARQGYAYPQETGQQPAHERDAYDTALSRHVQLLPSKYHLKNVKPWWTEKDVGIKKGDFTTQGSDLRRVAREIEDNDRSRTTYIKDASWFVDISHGGTPNLWTNICHFSNTMLPFFEAAHLGFAPEKPLRNVMLWQVPKSSTSSRFSNSSFHGAQLQTNLAEMLRTRKKLGRDDAQANSDPVKLWYDDDMPAGSTFCFEELVVVREPNLLQRRTGLQSRASMSTGGVARGFSSPSVRDAYRSAILTQLGVVPSTLRQPTLTYLTRPTDKGDRAEHGTSWQKRCHVAGDVYRKLKHHIEKSTGFKVQRVIFEKTPYVEQARIIAETDILWTTHGAGLVHMPLLPKTSAVVEMFNCDHFSYLYANMALHLGIKYFAMHRTLPECYIPQNMFQDLRRNMTKSYAYTYEEALPMLMQSLRYMLWIDPGYQISGNEEYCLQMNISRRLNGRLPPFNPVERYKKGCLGDSPAGYQQGMKSRWG